MNKIAQAIIRTRTRIDQRLADGIITQKQLDDLSRTLDLPFNDYCRFQEMKSLAVLEKSLSLEEAQLVYHYLGNIPDQFNRQPVEVKSVLTQLFAELLQRSISTRAARTHQ
jgi:predicted AAA+ superfamily ATPase